MTDAQDNGAGGDAGNIGEVHVNPEATNDLGDQEFEDNRTGNIGSDEGSKDGEEWEPSKDRLEGPGILNEEDVSLDKDDGGGDASGELHIYP